MVWAQGFMDIQYSCLQVFLSKQTHLLHYCQDDANMAPDIIEQIEMKILKRAEFITGGGARLGPYATCKIYNRDGVRRILATLETHPIDRGLDHYISNICSTGKQQIPLQIWTGGADFNIAPLDKSISKERTRKTLNQRFENK